MTRRTSFCIDRSMRRSDCVAAKRKVEIHENQTKTRRSKTTITIKCNQYIKFKFELKRNYINKQLDVHNN